MSYRSKNESSSPGIATHPGLERCRGLPKAGAGKTQKNEKAHIEAQVRPNCPNQRVSERTKNPLGLHLLGAHAQKRPRLEHRRHTS